MNLMEQKANELIAVIVPAYNCERTLRRSVVSALNSGFDNVRVYIVNDGSTDDTEKVADELKEDFGDRIFYHRQVNSGANKARNVGLRLSSSIFVQFLDSDDVIEPGKFKASLEKYKQNPGACCVYSSGWSVQECENGRCDGGRYAVQASDVNIQHISNCRGDVFTFAMNTSFPLWRKKFLDANDLCWDESLPCWQESEFYFRCLTSVSELSEMPIATHIPGVTLYRQPKSGNSISSAYWSDGYIFGQLRALDKILEHSRSFPEMNMDRQYQSFIRRLLIRSVVGGRRAAFLAIRKKSNFRLPVSSMIIHFLPYFMFRSTYLGYRCFKCIFNSYGDRYARNCGAKQTVRQSQE